MSQLGDTVPTNRVVIITGMHRSGTSLIASVLQNAGVFIGERLMGSNKGNPRGHFEDLDFYAFNEAILKRNQKTFLVQDMDGLREFSTQEIEQADQLVRERAGEAIWGWKDPRTTLFLEFWNERIPQANFLFLYRHPIAVSHSLLRRGAVYPENDAQSGLNSWCIYNQEILDFVAKYPEKCFLGNIDRIAQDLPGFIVLLNEKFGLALMENIDTSIFHPEELNHKRYEAPVLEAFRKAAPRSFQIYEQLEKLADIAEEPRAAGEMDDPQLSAALQVVIQKQLAAQENTEAQLNYLFSLIDPGLANSRAQQINEMLVEQQRVDRMIHGLNIQVMERDASIYGLNSQVVELRENLTNKDALVRSLVFQAAEREALVQKLKFQVSEQEALIRKTTERLNSIEFESEVLKGELNLSQNEVVEYALSRSWLLTRPLRKKLGYLHDLSSLLKNAKKYLVTQRSGMFDSRYYLKNNPDVRQADTDPLLHFLQHGWKDGRSPSDAFDTGAYLAANADVAATGVNPLLHYVHHGKQEGRNPKPVIAAPTQSQTPSVSKILEAGGAWLDEEVLETISELNG